MRRVAYLSVFFIYLEIMGGQDVRAQSGIHRCIGHDGETIFTDRPCAELQATERPSSVAKNAKVFVRSCAHSPDDLLLGIRSALEARDVNRFAEFYHWTGMSTQAAYQLMERLHSFSQRPLVDVQLLSSTDTSIANNTRDPDIDRIPNSAEQSLGIEATPLAPDHAPPPDLLRVDQATSDNDMTAQTTYFRLLVNADCWWIHF